MSRGQMGPIGLIIIDAFFILMWSTWVGGWINQIVSEAIATYNITGFEAFLWANLNLWIFIGLLLGNIIYFSVGASN